MTDDRRSIREIEADLERHRAELTYNIDLLQSKLSVDGAVRQIKQLAGDNLSDVSAEISRMVRTNPLAVALIGIGIVCWHPGGRPAWATNDGTQCRTSARSSQQSVGSTTAGRRGTTQKKPLHSHAPLIIIPIGLTTA